jgi:hypothetical protein
MGKVEGKKRKNDKRIGQRGDKREGGGKVG